MASKIFFNLPGGIKMPGVGLGTFQATDENELESALNHALEIGYRHIDTAFVYNNEKIIGRVINSWISKGKLKREDLFITTKLPMIGISPEKVETFMKLSLENLQLDYVDLYLVHIPIYIILEDGKSLTTMKALPTDLIGVWKKMEEQVDAGRTKAIGVSNFNIRQIGNILNIARIKPSNLQVELHLFLQQPELVKYCHEKGLSVVAYCPLGSPGHNAFRTKDMGLEPLELPNILQDPTVTAIAKKHNKTNAQVLLRFLLQKKIAVIPKSVTPSRLKENIDVFDFTLDAFEMKQLEKKDVGEKGRIADLRLIPEIENHPEYPF